MTQIIVPRTRIQHSSRNALTLQPSIVNVFLDLNAEFLDEVEVILQELQFCMTSKKLAAQVLVRAQSFINMS